MAVNTQKSQKPSDHLFCSNTPKKKRNCISSLPLVKKRWPCLAGASLFAAVVSGHHQVAVGTQLPDAGWLAAAVDRQRLAFRPRELQHAAGVVLEQVALERLPASADAHHHVLVVQHLLEGDGIKVLTGDVPELSRAEQSRAELNEAKLRCFFCLRASVISLMEAYGDGTADVDLMVADRCLRWDSGWFALERKE